MWTWHIENMNNKKVISEYDLQAQKFLDTYNLKINAVEAVPQTMPNWGKDGKYGIKWSITIGQYENKIRSDINIAGEKYTYQELIKEIQFFFWSSFHDKEKWINKNRTAYFQHKHPAPSNYDILASLYLSDDDLSSFSNFCENLGYSEDSREAEAIYKDCIELNDKLKTIMTSEALQELAQIQ